MKPAIMHLVVRDTYSDGLRIMAVTTAKARRYWGRDISTDTPMNVRAGDVIAAFAGPGAEATAKAVLAPIEQLNDTLRAAYRRAAMIEAAARLKAADDFEAAAKAIIAKAKTEEA